MNKLKNLAIVLLILAGFAAGAESKYVLSAKRLSSTEIGLSCNNGGDPAGQKIGNTLIISCGK